MATLYEQQKYADISGIHTQLIKQNNKLSELNTSLERIAYALESNINLKSKTI